MIWLDIAKAILIGVPVAVIALGLVSLAVNWTAGRHSVVGPICDQCGDEVDEVKPYEHAGPGRHSTRLVCDSCAFRLIAADLQAGESPGFGRHADEAMAVVREADERDCPGLYGSVAANDYHPAGSCDACAEPPDLSVLHEFDANRAKGDQPS